MSTMSIQSRPTHLREVITPSAKIQKRVLGAEYSHAHSYVATPTNSNRK